MSVFISSLEVGACPWTRESCHLNCLGESGVQYSFLQPLTLSFALVNRKDGRHRRNIQVSSINTFPSTTEVNNDHVTNQCMDE